MRILCLSMSTKLHSLIEIVWADACGADGWISSTRLNEAAGLSKISTIGYFVKEDEFSITLSMAIDHTNENYGAFMTIPKVNIKRKKKLG